MTTLSSRLRLSLIVLRAPYPDDNYLTDPPPMTSHDRQSPRDMGERYHHACCLEPSIILITTLGEMNEW